MNKVSAWLYPFFCCFAACGLFMAYKLMDLAFEEMYLQKHGIKTLGTVIKLLESKDDGSILITPVVEFETKRGELITYEFSYSTNINPAELGQKLTVLYDPVNPNRHLIEKETSGMSWVSGILMLSHGGIGFGGMIWLYRKRKFTNWILLHGQNIQATFEALKINADEQMVLAKWMDPNTKVQYSFYSDYFGFNWSDNDFVGKQIPIIIDPSNPKRYIMDLSNWGV